MQYIDTWYFVWADMSETLTNVIFIHAEFSLERC